MNPRNPQVDGYIRKSPQWQAELQKLRTIALGCGLTEEVKWRHPCYTAEGKNIVIAGRFKEYCAMTFVKGSLLTDPKRVLAQIGENTQVARVIRFTNVRQIEAIEGALEKLIHEAVAVEKSGVKATYKKTLELPEELQAKLDELPALKAAFAKLTPGRQRAYALYISSAKQSKTRASRVEKHIPTILSGKGIDD